jgi:ketosteroid isomerase-like protein
VVRRHFDTFREDGLEAAAQLWHPQIKWHPLEGAGVVSGHAAMRRYYAEWVETMEDLRGDVEETVVEDGDRVVVLIRNSGRGRVSGVPASGSYFVTCVVRDGRIVSGREFATRDEAIAAATA